MVEGHTIILPADLVEKYHIITIIPSNIVSIKPIENLFEINKKNGFEASTTTLRKGVASQSL